MMVHCSSLEVSVPAKHFLLLTAMESRAKICTSKMRVSFLWLRLQSFLLSINCLLFVVLLVMQFFVSFLVLQSS